MKYRFSVKDPNIDYSMNECMNRMISAGEGKKDVVEAREEAESKVLPLWEKWVKFGEYVTLELDTDTGTMTVIPVEGK